MRKYFKKVGSLVICIGILLVAYAGYLFIEYEQEESNAKAFSSSVVNEIHSNYIDDDTTEKAPQELTFDEILIDDEGYIGTLIIPSLDLELAIQSEWSYAKLKNTPCMYSNKPFSIAAHNYISHFSRLKQMSEGDEVIFVDINGTKYYFKVCQPVYLIHESNVEELQDEAYDLTLFTCNRNNNTQRYIVRLDRVK